MPTKYNRRRTRKQKRSRKSRKQRGGALSTRTQRLLRNEYNGLSGTKTDRPSIVELNQFMIENNIEEPLYEVMDNIVNLLGRLLRRPTEQEAEEADRLAELARDERQLAINRSGSA